MNANPPKKSPATVTSEPQELELEHQIRLRAYELFEARGREDGHDIEDWLQAETELTKRRSAPSPPNTTCAPQATLAPTARGLFHAGRRISITSIPRVEAGDALDRKLREGAHLL